MMEPRLRKLVKDHDERMLILKEVICESQRPGEARLPPGLVMALIHVESRFDHYAVSSAGAVGLMQVMPFWPEELGMKRHELIRIPQNIRMGCAILRFYLKKERNSVTRALARYNGSVGRRTYSDLVMNQWSRYNGADDLGLDAPSAGVVVRQALSAQPVVKRVGRSDSSSIISIASTDVTFDAVEPSHNHSTSAFTALASPTASTSTRPSGRFFA